ncbi:hypothetical protein CH263_02440 [Rhodococcus sp. 06-1059B-a]|nr:type I polyketide synthase [Rhodococcus sp. 06-1059B-a]OZD73415.1 hypothetical protein CH263_02440 [Rhodococcus sp. 06-1059B-a]
MTDSAASGSRSPEREAEDQKILRYLKKVTAELQRTRERLRAVETEGAEPIAVVATGCRFAGGIDSPEALWDKVMRGEDVIGDFPTDRGWDLDAVYDPDPESAGTSYVRRGCFIDAVGDFDPAHFGISPREAELMDPQQRLLLEVSWEALERGGIAPGSLRGGQVGVYVGTNGQDYRGLLDRIPAERDSALGTGTLAAVISGRISYVLGLEGPAVTVDTACSSALVGMHLAATALRNRECSLALAGGATVMTTPDSFIAFSRQRGLAIDGRCKAFSDDADGTGWGEGVGMIVLERLSDAQRNGHPVLAVLAGSAINSDGASNGLTAPNGPSQQRVIRSALTAAGLSGADVDVLEAHGTGTTLGDPIEAQALMSTYGRTRGPSGPLLLGSIKSNIGHTQAAAGAAGVIKMVTALGKGIVPATLHVSEPSSTIDWTAGAVELVTETTHWPAVQRVRRAGVSSFGASGTNAHVILEQAPAPEAPDERTPGPLGSVRLPFLVSGRTAAARDDQARSIAALLEEPGIEHDAVAGALALTRTHLRHRAAMVGRTPADSARGLKDTSDTEVSVLGIAGDRIEPVFVFPGQGSQWRSMATELMSSSPVFAARMAECAQACSSYVEWDLLEELSGPQDRVDVVQPLLWAVMVSLAHTWQACGVSPAAVIGHSQGEIAAAVVAGALSLDDGARVVTLRSRAIARDLAGRGGMMSIGESAETVRRRLTAHPELSVAAINGARSVVVSGDVAALDALTEELVADDVRIKRLPVDYASHSAHVDSLRATLDEVLSGLSPRSSEIPFYSTVTGEPIDTAVLDAKYWFTNLRGTVRFAETVERVIADGFGLFVESSPHPVLTLGIAETADSADGPVVATVPSLRRDDGGPERFVASLAEAHVHGAAVDWKTVMGSGLAPVALPTYPFQRQMYWPEAGWSVGDVRSAGVDATGHRLLGGAVVQADGGGAVFTGRLSTATHPWLADHALGDVVIFPGTGHLELVAAAAERLGCGVVEDLTLGAPLVIPDGAALGIQVIFGAPDDTGRRHVGVYSTSDDTDLGDRSWQTHATGTVGTGAGDVFVGNRLDSWPPPGAEAVDVADLYAGYAEANLHYGPAFRAVTAAWRVGDDVYATVNSPVDVDGVDLHPAVADAALHAIGLTSIAGDDALLPFSWSDVRIHAVGAHDVRVRVHPVGDFSVSVDIADFSGAPVASIGELVVRAVSADALPVHRKNAGDLYQVVEVALEDNATDLEAAESTVVEALSGSTATEVEAALVLLVSELREALDSDAETVAVVVPGDPAGAAAAGLVRAAAAEEPDRIVLVTATGDIDVEDAVTRARAAGEPHVVVRGSEVFTPRLVRADTAVSDDGLRTDGTVLITGASGVLAGELARHLVHGNGIRHLTLLSRSVISDDLIDELTSAGAEISQVRCDVTDAKALSAVFDALPAERPLRGVIHTAGVLADGTFGALTPERLGVVLAPKVHGAWNLHELTRERDLDVFVMFSSTAGVLGAPGQANYSAANAYLDALAELRRGVGLPAQSLAWGLWAQGSGMTGSMDGTDRSRLTRGGITPLATDDAFALFDRGLRSPNLAAVVAADFDLAGMRSRGERPDPAFRSLVTVRRTSAAAQVVDENAWRSELSAADPAQRERMVTDLVRGRIATILGHRSVDGVPADRPFKELGFDSLAAVELRNALSAVTGLRLPATLVFDHPTPVVLARKLIGDLGDTVTSTPQKRAPAVSSDEPVAIIGMACRYPGGVESPDDLWDLVASGRDVVGGFPDDRGWDLDRLYDPTLDRPGTSYSRQGSFLDGAGDFDADLFGIDPLEANSLDPQVRQLLETSRTALEHAAIDPTSLAGTDTGTYVGLMYHDYAGAYGTGSVVSGRVAYELGLEGPTMTVDTACSSSLVALHLAAQALRAGECGVALAGGVTVMATPGIFVEFSRQRGLSPDGRCRSFADSANGTGFSEGVGVLVLERLSDARRNGRNILAVLRGSAVNQDGASNGPTAPNGPAQQRVIRRALDSAGLTTADVDVVEAHGTGTTLGDPIEAQALIDTYGRGRATEDPLWLGSIKSNIGHSQAAAGVAGVIKMVQALRHREMPATLHVDGTPSRHIDWEDSGVALLADGRQWPERDRPLRAAVSSFGLSGTNAHVVLEAAPATERVVPQAYASIPWLLSGTSAQSLRTQAAALAAGLAANQDVDAVGTARTLATGRAQLGHRAALVGSDVSELRTALTALVAGDASANAMTGTARSGRTAFLFTGQGAQRPGMGSEAAAAHSAFERALAEVCSYADPLLDTPLREAIASPELVGRTEYTQPALFAVQIATYRFLTSLGVQPDALVGHSIGEIAVAHVAGVLDLPSAVRLVCARGRLMQALPDGGAMVAIGAPVDEVRPYLTSDVGLAAVNGPAAVVVSGTESAVEAIAARFERTTRLRVSHAFHSPSMLPMIDEFRTVVEDLEFGSPTIPIVSTVTGEPVTDGMADPEYWVRHVTGTVRFEDAVNTLCNRAVARMVEIGPGSTLSSLASSCVADADAPPEVFPTLRSGRPEPEALSVALARIHVSGGIVDWSSLLGSGAPAADLPTYVYSHRRYWINSDVVEHDRSAHPILGGAVEIAGTGTTLYSSEISVATHPWLADHRMGTTVVVPGTVFAEIAVVTASSVGSSTVRELTVTTPLVLSDTGSRTLQASVSGADREGVRELSIYSAERAGGEWTLHAVATLADDTLADDTVALDPDSDQWPSSDAHDVTAVDVDALYAAASTAGVDYGRTFRGLTAVWVRGDDVYAEVSADALMSGGATGSGHVLHPAFFDAVLQPVTARQGAGDSVVMPFSWSGIRITPSRSNVVRVRLAATGSDTVRVTAVDDRGLRVVDIESLTLREVSVRRFSALGVADGLSVIERIPLSTSGSPTATHWTVVSSDPVAAAALADEAATVRTATDIADAASVATDVVVVGAWGDGGLDAHAGSSARRRLHDVAEHIRRWSSEPALAATTLVVWTAGVADSAVKGLVRSAASENAGTIVLVDALPGVDAPSALRALPAALATGESDIVIGTDGIYAPRLTAAPAFDGDPQQWPDTVLVTGGTGAVGGTVAKHLVRTHAVGHVVLMSRRGLGADGAPELVSAIEDAGGRVTVVAGDIADEATVRAVFDAHPIRGVVHAAGVLDDGLLETMTEDRTDAVARPKIDAALVLHAVTIDHAVEKFVLFSSTAGILGSPGQSNYAAANTFLDGLAQHRQTLGMAATSLVWGRWSGGGGMADRLDDSGARRLAESGIVGMSDEDALALFDAAVDRGDAVVVPARFDVAGLTARFDASPASVAPVLRGLLRRTTRAASPTDRGAELRASLAELSVSEQSDLVDALVHDHTSAVLGVTDIDMDSAFGDLGFDSLAAVEFRNRLVEATGLRLPATVVFDHPSPAVLAAHLLTELVPQVSVRETVIRERAVDIGSVTDDDIDALDTDALISRALGSSDESDPSAE